MRAGIGVRAHFGVACGRTTSRGMALALVSAPMVSRAQTTAPAPVKNVVLVHGAWADGSSWSNVIPILQAKGLRVVAVQNPLTSFADDVSATKRIIDAQDGPVLLVGHSYGGAVITKAGNNPKVVGLVYVAAFAPDNGEALGGIGKEFSPAPAMGELRPIADGFVLLSPQGVTLDFAQDLSTTEKNTMVAIQTPTSGSLFASPVTNAAWHSRPSWYVVAANDRTINPDFERSMADRMKAKTLTVASSQVAMLSQPQRAADFIASAASAAGK